MLITEVLNKPIKGLKVSGKKPIQDVPSPTNKQIVGMGSQAVAYLHKKFPDKVIKVVQVSGTSDPQYQFLRVCLNNQKNPFFPKILAFKMYHTYQSTKQYKDFQEYSKHDHRLARLRNFDEFETEFDDVVPTPLKYTIYLVMERLYPITSKDLEMWFKHLNILPTLDDITPKQQQLMSRALDPTTFVINCAFDRPRYRARILNDTNNPDFKKALRILERLFSHYESDMNPGNFMVRNNGQLVLIDPITI